MSAPRPWRVLRALIGSLLLAALALPALAEQVLVLKDGRRIAVTRLERRGAKVRFQTAKGEAFEIDVAQVVSPPLAEIPEAGAPAAPQTLVLKDGRRIAVTRLARRGGLVLFQTQRGEGFSVSQDQVVSPPLEQIPSLDPPPEPVPVPTPSPAPTPEPPAPTPPPAPPVVPRPPAPPASSVPDFVPLPDRWAIAYPPYPGRNVQGSLLDPYNQNVLKGDRPVIGQSVFLVLGATLDAPTELRRLPTPSGTSTAEAGEAEFFGRGRQLFTTPRVTFSAELFRGQTAFRPKTWALKASGVLNLNYVRLRENNNVDVDVREGRSRTRTDFALEEAFAELKLADLSPRFDALSLRAGIQPFVSDFRGLLFSDVNLGARLFGNAASNRWQYNLAFFDLLEKQTNSELNTFEKREQQVALVNVFRQDFLAPGYTLSASFHWSRDDATRHYDANGFLVRPARIGSLRPHEVRARYVGLAGDGHVGRLNLSHAAYYAFGHDDDHPLADRPIDVRAFLGALELSLDRDWARFKATAFFASGDDDPLDGTGRGFDSIYDNSNFAGGPFSFWSRSGIALTQTGVLLKAPGSLLPNLRSNKFEGQQSFVNPGLMLLGAGVDLDLTPQLRAVLNVNHLRFHRTGALELLVFQPGMRRDIGWDLGMGVLWRPLLSENVVLSAGLTGLVPGGGFDDLYSSTCSTPGCGAPSRALLNGFVNLKLSY